MALLQRLREVGPADDSPEDFLSSALSVIFTDDVTGQHGDADHGLLYTSPYLAQPLHIVLPDPKEDAHRSLFSHHLWNSSLQLAEIVEGGSISTGGAGSSVGAAEEEEEEKKKKMTLSSPPPVQSQFSCIADFDVRGLSTIELGAGTALPSILAALFGAARVTVTDYPAPVILDTLQTNIQRNVPWFGKTNKATDEAVDPLGTTDKADEVVETDETDGPGEAGETGKTLQQVAVPSSPPHAALVTVGGHEWGVFEHDSALVQEGRHAYDRVFVCDCLWMPWQHDNLRRSIDWFLKEEEDKGGEDGGDSHSLSSPRCWIVAGFHTGRAQVAAFFDTEALADNSLEVDRIWERECNGNERPWAEDRDVEDKTARKRWLVMAVLRRARRARRPPS